MNCFKKKEEEFWTRYGVLKGDSLSTAKNLQAYFVDYVTDGSESDYYKARRLWANPAAYCAMVKIEQEQAEELKQEDDQEEVEEADKVWIKKVRAMQLSKQPGDIVEPIYKTKPDDERDFDGVNYDTKKQLGDLSE